MSFRPLRPVWVRGSFAVCRFDAHIAKAAQLLTTTPALDPAEGRQLIAAVMDPVEPAFAQLVRQLPLCLGQDPAEAMRWIAAAGANRAEFDRPIITPFVVPSVLASLWCLWRYPDSWPQAVTAAIRLGGDVDTLGAIVGALAGAKFGAAAIPAHLAGGVVDSGRLKDLARRHHALVNARVCNHPENSRVVEALVSGGQAEVVRLPSGEHSLADYSTSGRLWRGGAR